jgi:hypothetical protein
MCQTALTNSEEGRAMGPRFNRAILVLLAAPYLVAAVVAGTLFRHRVVRWWRTAASRRPGRLA